MPCPILANRVPRQRERGKLLRWLQSTEHFLHVFLGVMVLVTDVVDVFHRFSDSAGECGCGASIECSKDVAVVENGYG